jgi:nucleoside-diphosphate-sugar epimerase
MINNFNVLITGIDGFSGSKIRKFLDYYKISSIGISRRYKKKKIIKLDLTKKINYKFNQKIDWVIHTAAIHKVSDYKKKFNNNKNKNILMTQNLIELAKKQKIKNFIFFSTIDISLKNISGIKKDYNLSKLKSEKIILDAYKKKIFDKVIILRIPAILGKGANKNFLNDTIKKIKKNEKIIINDRLKYNNFVHIEDLCRLILKIFSFCKKHRNKNLCFLNILNCLSSKYIHISKKILKIKDILNSSSKILILKKKDSYKFLSVKKNKFNFEFMTCDKAIKLIL